MIYTTVADGIYLSNLSVTPDIETLNCNHPIPLSALDPRLQKKLGYADAIAGRYGMFRFLPLPSLLAYRELVNLETHAR